MRRLFTLCLFLVICQHASFALDGPIQASVTLPCLPQTAVFTPDACSVEWCGPAFIGILKPLCWIVVHIEGEPYERGVQHGKLLSNEIARYVRCMAENASSKDPSEAWHQTRTIVNGLFLHRFEREYLEEMQGIADGCRSSERREFRRPAAGFDRHRRRQCLGGDYDDRRRASGLADGPRRRPFSRRARTSRQTAARRAVLRIRRDRPGDRRWQKSSSGISRCTNCIPRRSSISGSTSSLQKAIAF